MNVTLTTHLLSPWLSSFTTTLLLHAMRSRSVAIWLRRALLCICRTPSIWPLRRSPIFGEDMSIFGLLRAKTKTKRALSEPRHQTFLDQRSKHNRRFIVLLDDIPTCLFCVFLPPLWFLQCCEWSRHSINVYKVSTALSIFFQALLHLSSTKFSVNTKSVFNMT